MRFLVVAVAALGFYLVFDFRRKLSTAGKKAELIKRLRATVPDDTLF